MYLSTNQIYFRFSQKKCKNRKLEEKVPHTFRFFEDTLDIYTDPIISCLKDDSNGTYEL